MTRFFFIALLSISACASNKALQNTEPAQTGFEKTSLQSLDGTKINGYLYRPEGKGPFPAIVALHGCSGLFRKSGNLNSRDYDWGTRLVKSGYVVLYPDSFTTRGIDEICTRQDSTNFPRKTRTMDAYGALAWLQSQNYVRTNRVALMGWSNGGSSLLWTIDQHSKARPARLANDFKLAIAFYPGCHLVTKDKSWENKIPLEILIGQLDNWTSPNYCISLVQKHANTSITLYPNSYHDFDHPHMPHTVMKNIAFVSNHTTIVETNPEARAQAIEKVMGILEHELKNL